MYPYTLEPYTGMNTKHTCPQCGKKKTFTRYIDTQTGEYLAEHLGRCDREIKCGYHARPDSKSQYSNPKSQRFIPRKQTLPATNLSTIPLPLFQSTLCNYEENNLVQFLVVVLGRELAMQVVAKYFIGTHTHWPGSTAFWQVDEQNNIRTGKIMLYDYGGRRVKEPFSHVSWVHSAEGLTNYNLSQCLFGQHLLRGNTKTIAITESEKTAVIASAFVPEFTWMATGSLSNLSAEKLKPLKGHNIILYPDLGAEDKWGAIAATIDNCCVSRRLQEFASTQEIEQGLDFADYLLWKIRHLTG